MVLVPAVGLPGAVLAQTDCTCIVAPSASGSFGVMSDATGSVFITGASGPQAVLGGAELATTTGISIGANGTANVSYGESCNLALGGSVSVAVSPLADGNMCVQVFEEAPPPPPSGDGMGMALAAGGGLAIGGVLLFGTGIIPVSQ